MGFDFILNSIKCNWFYVLNKFMLQQKFRSLDFRRRAYFCKSNRLNILSLFTSMLRFTNHSMYILAEKYGILNFKFPKFQNTLLYFIVILYIKMKPWYFIKNISLLSRYNNIATKICFNNDTLVLRKKYFLGFYLNIYFL